MPWFKIDDSAHSHPKFIRAGNAALGLWLRCGSYSAQHLLEGFVPMDIVKPFKGTPAQVRKLIDAGLWHEAGHDCKSCPQPADGYMIHDFFEGGRNTTRAQHEANKQGAVERAAKSRANRKAAETERDSDPKANRNGSDSRSNRVQNEPHFSSSTAGQGTLSHRTPAERAALTHAAATPLPGTSSGSTPVAAARGGEPEIRSYDTLGDLKRAIAAAGITGISWNLQASQIERARQVCERVGVGPMVALAVNNANYRGAPGSASAWLADWESLEPEATSAQPDSQPSTEIGGKVLRFTPGQRPSTTDARVNQALETGRRLQALHDAQTQENQ
ncbi:hypothetical protein GTY67_13665 [Streptomyces sp. SID8374]|uniref:hypothetical protein n=1 Tax=Streptomyces sp. SID8374 TaxID=2690354 RepID=UPI001370C99D|nr:hypothetical protein [Streptomyces sp. SID8374]MYX14445.1 hypothetical protein [Streptomyces sp. SID8374]